MTDAFEATGDFSPAETFSTDSSIDSFSAESFTGSAPELSAAPAPALSDATDGPEAEPNGFVKLGLAAELLQAVQDLGFTQPTTV